MKTEVQHRRAPAKIFTHDEKRALILKWKHSGLSKAAFCQSIGLTKSAFYSWCIQFQDELSDDKKFFSPVTLKASSTKNTDEPIQLEICFPNQLKIFAQMQKLNAISFIQELCHATTIIR